MKPEYFLMFIIAVAVVGMVYNYIAYRREKASLGEVPVVQNTVFVELNYRVAAKLNALLKEKGMTTHELAQKLGEDDTEVAQWLTGRRDFTLSTIEDIEFALDRKLIVVQHDNENVEDMELDWLQDMYNDMEKDCNEIEKEYKGLKSELDKLKKVINRKILKEKRE